eukprot:gb/GEZN01004888.1/.p1 GENE.gb/GEZN01004888.1/~~gb/GEZN01004888.1/.p1  ORF type:complete len:419 (-),score=80.30 gb/GEZN01004888.1/:601-1857(-)
MPEEAAKNGVKAENGAAEPERLDGQLMTGTVKWWNLDKGYGFLTADDGGSDVFLHQSEIQTEKFRALILGTEVQGKFQVRDGKPILLKITGKDGAKLPVIQSKMEAAVLIQQQQATIEPELAPGFLRGTIKWFSAEKGFGFILPAEEGDPDIFLHKSHVALTRLPMSGEKVHYSTKEDKNGKKVANEVKFLSPPQAPMPTSYPQPAMAAPGLYGQPYGMPDPNAYGQQAYGAPARPQAYGAESPYGAPGVYGGAVYDPYQQQTQAFAAPLPGGTEMGTVKFFDEAKKFGFVIPTTGGKDVHFKGENVRGAVTSIKQGVAVQFTRRTAADGKCWAENVSLASAATLAAAAARAIQPQAYAAPQGYGGMPEPVGALGKRKFDTYGAGSVVPTQPGVNQYAPATAYGVPQQQYANQYAAGY